MLGSHRPTVKGKGVISPVAQVWRWRRLVLDVAQREFRARYAGSVLGAVWAILEPALQVGLYVLVFGYFVGTSFVGGGGVGTYALHLVAGMVPFLAFQECVIRASGFARSQAALVRHINVPVEVLLAGSLLAVLARYAVAMALVVAGAGFAGGLAWTHLVWLLPATIVLVALTWGLALALVPMGAFVPDVGQLVITGTSVLFFLTPIVYQMDRLPPRAARYVALNPMTGVVDLFRAGVAGSELSGARLAVTLIATVLALWLGSGIFTRHARTIRDLV